MVARAPLVEVLPASAYAESPIYLVSLRSRHVLPRVRAFLALVEAELAREGANARAARTGRATGNGRAARAGR